MRTSRSRTAPAGRRCREAPTAGPRRIAVEPIAEDRHAARIRRAATRIAWTSSMSSPAMTPGTRASVRARWNCRTLRPPSAHGSSARTSGVRPTDGRSVARTVAPADSCSVAAGPGASADDTSTAVHPAMPASTSGPRCGATPGARRHLLGPWRARGQLGHQPDAPRQFGSRTLHFSHRDGLSRSSQSDLPPGDGYRWVAPVYSGHRTVALRPGRCTTSPRRQSNAHPVVQHQLIQTYRGPSGDPGGPNPPAAAAGASAATGVDAGVAAGGLPAPAFPKRMPSSPLHPAAQLLVDHGRADERREVELPVGRVEQERAGLRAAQAAVGADELLERGDLAASRGRRG